MRTIVLLIASNVFMTFAWYYHLKQQGWPLWKAIVISWIIALFEYCLMVPANRLGYANGFSGFQLKLIQEIITLVVFAFFAVIYLKEPCIGDSLSVSHSYWVQFILCSANKF